MTADFQTIAALVVVALTAIWLVAHAFSKRSKPGCGGCPSQKKSRVPKGWKIVRESGASGRSWKS